MRTPDAGAGWPAELWYVAYGSNLLRARLDAYLLGSGDDGPFGRHVGAGDQTPPLADRWLSVGQPLYFAGHSRRWNGAPAFLGVRAEPGVRTLVRAWLLQRGQVEAVFGQENGFDRLALPSGPADLWPGQVALTPGGRYRAVLRLDDIDGVPALTCTSDRPAPGARPSTSYRAVIEAGLAEGAGLGPAEVAAYLDAAERRAPPPLPPPIPPGPA